MVRSIDSAKIILANNKKMLYYQRIIPVLGYCCYSFIVAICLLQKTMISFCAVYWMILLALALTMVAGRQIHMQEAGIITLSICAFRTTGKC